MTLARQAGVAPDWIVANTRSSDVAATDTVPTMLAQGRMVLNLKRENS